MLESTKIPIIKLYNNLIVSIQVALSDQLVLRLKDDVSREIERTGARGLIIDVSGVDIMDSYITRTIRDIALIAKIMGTDTVLCGLDPMIAMTLIEMGLDLSGLTYRMSLEDALEHLLELQHQEQDDADDLPDDELPVNTAEEDEEKV
ncbi:STAS domain-containing protein [bacterium]|nr:STAS domain-containing protein [bacterium]